MFHPWMKDETIFHPWMKDETIFHPWMKDESSMTRLIVRTSGSWIGSLVAYLLLVHCSLGLAYSYAIQFNSIQFGTTQTINQRLLILPKEVPSPIS
jgi:hypothetical protein